VGNRVLAMRLAQGLGWVFETQERKKEIDILSGLFQQTNKQTKHKRRSVVIRVLYSNK